jgi:aspartate aminotransferase
VICNSPNNPSGVMYPESFIQSLVEFCERRGLYLIMDDIYHKLVFDGKRAAPGYEFTTRDVETSKIIVINGVSKIYGMTGFRIGWAVANKQMIKVMDNVQSQVTSGPSVVVQAAAEGALTGLQGGVEVMRQSIENNRNIIMQELAALDGVKLSKPDGTFYCFPDFSAFNTNSLQLSEFLLKKALVVTVPGREFGREGHLRLSYSGTIKDVTEGVARIRWALDPKSPAEIYIGDRRVVRDWL